MEAANALAGLGIQAPAQERSVPATQGIKGPPPGKITGQAIGYDQIVDHLLLSPPGETQRALAKRLGYTETWLSRLISSDAFQVRLAKRLEEIDPDRREIFRLRFASIEEEARAILMDSLRKLAVRLEDPAGVPDELLIKSATMTSKLLGYGARKDPPVQKVEMHVHLEQLAQNVRKLNQAPSAEALDGQCTEVK